jgi:hypothetical protein
MEQEELPQQREECITVAIHKKGDKADCKNYRSSYQQPTKLYPTFF